MREPAVKTTYTLAEAADLLSCHKETLRRAIHGGELLAAKLGREYRLSRRDLEAFWVASGGGELFEKAEVTPQVVSEAPAALEAAKESKKKDEPEQLSLFPMA